ncbi:PREDICTED: ubiquitin-like-specific protease 1C isoform X2 [Camelina sativa]|uniref:Ubiquitin-like-specific protease 1C isoform X2 n=1 Tax=Camelina sativa TaxID=90675 RepID=A0ABM0WTH6_CAMSA|nr:PREDICTED: ubiquitin-like-specific protease 1C isoform X2 [Camelina sativa]
MKRQRVIELDRVVKTKLNIDWDDALAEEDVPELEIIGTDKIPPPEPTISGEESAVCVRSLRDNELDEHLKRQRSLLILLGDKLPDKGDKIRNRIGDIEYEKQRRMLQRTKPDADNDGCQILEKPRSSGVSRQENTASKDSSRQRSSDNPKVDAQPVKLFNDKTQDLERGSWKGKFNRDSIVEKSNGWRSLPRLSKCNVSERNFYSGSKDPKGNRKLNGKAKPKESSPYLLVDDDDDEDDVVGYETPRERSVKTTPSQSSSCKKKSDDQVINLDEDEPQSPTVLEEACELPEGLPEDIYYPSSDQRDGRDLVQVSLEDLKCLSPGEYLKSPVINFYLRFLQHHVFSTNETVAHCHFFNTFFYKKLTEAVSYKGNDKDAFFVRFRRWWKGLDLFRKSYIFIPIHEDLHWSLVIICIPDQEDESGLTIIHLDSLGLHPRSLIFNNVKRFLREEWNYLNQDDSMDLPISAKVWRDLPNMINEAEVQVPQQKNDFDCGLFVLFFIKRFIEEAPERLKLKDLGMIHKKWFKPDEASALRIKIWNILVDLFRKGNQTD